MIPVGFASWTTVCGVAVVVLVCAHAKGLSLLAGAAKTVAAAAFVGAAFSGSEAAPTAAYAGAVRIGLLLCALGDVLLIREGRGRLFLAGIGSFLLGHVAFAAAFAQLALSPVALVLTAVGIAWLAWRVLGWLRPHVPPDFRLPVHAYVFVIAGMVVIASGATFGAGAWLAGAGALAFAASDLSVARDRFVAPGFVNGAWGLPLYFAAQITIAATVAWA